MTGISITILGEDNMSHNSSKKQWDALTTKEKELIWLKHHNTRILPSSISGSELDKIFKNENVSNLGKNLVRDIVKQHKEKTKSK